MESTQSWENVTAGNVTTPEGSLDTCYLFDNVYFEMGGITLPYIVNAALNVPLAIVATIANILIFSTIRQSASLHLPSKLLLCGLVMTDVCVGLLVQPLYVGYLIAKVKELSGVRCLFLTLFVFFASLLNSVSIMTMTLMSLDRYIALHFHLRYREIVTVRRVCVSLVIIWLAAGFFGSTSLWNIVYYDLLGVISLPFCILTTSVVYIKIYRTLRHQHGHQIRDQANIPNQPQVGETLNVSKFRRSTSNMLWIYYLYMLCYLPYVCNDVARQTVGHSVLIQTIREFSLTVMFMNSCLNPFVYCLRIPSIRAGVLQKLFRQSSHQ